MWRTDDNAVDDNDGVVCLRKWQPTRQKGLNSITGLVCYSVTTVELLRAAMRSFRVLSVDGVCLWCNAGLTMCMEIAYDAYDNPIPATVNLMKSENGMACKFQAMVLVFLYGRFCERLAVHLRDGCHVFEQMVARLKGNKQIGVDGDVWDQECWWHVGYKPSMAVMATWSPDKKEVGYAVMSLLKYVSKYAEDWAAVDQGLRDARKFVDGKVKIGLLSEAEGAKYTGEVIDYVDDHKLYLFPSTCHLHAT